MALMMNWAGVLITAFPVRQCKQLELRHVHFSRAEVFCKSDAGPYREIEESSVHVQARAVEYFNLLNQEDRSIVAALLPAED